jgi:hypothetical protein
VLVALALLIALGSTVTLAPRAAARRSATVTRRFIDEDRSADVIVPAWRAARLHPTELLRSK